MFIKNKPVLSFEAQHADVDPNIIRTAKSTVPKWYKEAPVWVSPPPKATAHDAIPSVKLCMPYVEALTLGYVVVLPMDVVVTLANDGAQHLSWRIGGQLVDIREKSKISYFPAPMGCSDVQYTWKLPLSFSVPEGYSVLYTHPLNRPELPFFSLSGVMDGPFTTSMTGNVPFYIKKDYEGIINQGTPIAQLIPFKNESWVSEIKEGLLKEGVENSKKSMAVMSGWYKSNYWRKKSFN